MQTPFFTPFLCGIAGTGRRAIASAIGITLAKIALGTVVSTAIGLAIGGTIAGIQAALTGHGFWDAFGEYVTENFVDELVMNFAFTSVAAAVGNLLGPKHCFAAGTLVATQAGLKPIEDIEVGDEVLAYDEETGEQAYKPVTRLFRNTTEEWYHVRVNDEEIICTGGHPFYILNADNSRNILEFEGVKSNGTGKWICARDLKKSDKVLLSDGSCAIIESIEVETLSAPETTYNFEVADYHTYYVSDSKVLVHNKCVKEMQMTSKEAVKYGKEFLGEGYEKIGKGMYRSKDGLRTMRYDFTHHSFRGKFYSGPNSPAHINLYTWKVPVTPGVRNKLLQETIIWLI